jgi:hypothetical protein
VGFKRDERKQGVWRRERSSPYYVEESPEAAARQEIRKETGLSSESIALVCKGEPFTVEDSDLTIQWTVHPCLFDCETRDIETVPNLWKSYDRVRPTVETIAEDSEHGSAWLSIRALEVLRDEAALSVRAADDGSAIAAVADELLDARPSMTVIENRINRVMADSDQRPEAVETRANSDYRPSDGPATHLLRR